MIDITIDPLKRLYMEYKEKLLPEAEAVTIPVTQNFMAYLKGMVKHGHSVNVAVRGEVVSGKSTVAIAIAQKVNKIIEEIKGKEQPQMGQVIFSDQTEFLRFISKKIEDVAIVIDEFNRMAGTGLNATTEETLFDFYSDVFAQRHIHRISCSPSMVADKNATVILDVIGKDEESKITRCKLVYRDIIDRNMLTLGFIDVKVGEVINKTFYKKYREKKFKRMDLLEKHGVRDIREPEFATIILDVIKELQELAKIRKIPRDLVMTYTDMIRRRHNRHYSMLALADITSKASGLLNTLYEVNKLEKSLKKPKLLEEERIIINNNIAKIKVTLEQMYQEQEDLAKIYVEYMNITA